MFYVVNVTIGKMEFFKDLSSAIDYCERKMFKYKRGVHYMVFDETGELVEEMSIKREEAIE